MNDEKLKAMGVHPEIADAYLNNSLYSPREQTLLVYALEQMKGVADRSAFIRLAALTNNVDMASFRERQAKMYVGYNRSVTPLERFISLGEFQFKHNNTRTTNSATESSTATKSTTATVNTAATVSASTTVTTSKLHGTMKE